MPIFQTNLLIRDKRLEDFEAKGCKLQWHTLTEEEADIHLRAKLMEEATESALSDTPDELIKECADVLEVVEALATLHGFTFEDVLAAKAKRKAKLGGFEKRIFSESITAPEGSETTTYHRQFPDKYPEVQS